MAIMEYQKDNKKVYKVYVQCRGKTIKRIRLQKVVYHIETLEVARREEKRLIKELAEKVAKLEGKGLLWSEVIERWEDAGQRHQLGSRYHWKTLGEHVNRLKRYTRPWLNMIASDLNKADGRRVIAFAESKGATISVLNKLKSSINLVYNWGVEEGIIQITGMNQKSPVYGLCTGPKEEKIQPILTVDEVRKFLFEAKLQQHPWYPIWAFAVATGMRSGELMALEWGDIDDQNGVIRVTKSFNKKFKITKCPKNGTWRNIDVNAPLQGLINELRVQRGNERTVLPLFHQWQAGLGGEILRIFLKRIGIDKHVVLHTLRACFATHLLSTGVEPLKVMRMGGWSDLKTFQIYLRLSGVDVKGITQSFDLLPPNELSDNVVPLFS